MKDDDLDGNDMPLGKIIKRLKAKSSKAKRGVKGATLFGESKEEDDMDILRVVREIDLDDVGISNKFESTNGHQDDTPDFTPKHNLQEKKRIVGSETSSPIPKRQRSSSQGSHKFSWRKNISDGPKRTSTESLPLEQKILSSEFPERDDEVPYGSEDKISLQENIVKTSESILLTTCSQNNSNSSKRKRKTSGKDHIVKIRKDEEDEVFDTKVCISNLIFSGSCLDLFPFVLLKNKNCFNPSFLLL